VCRSAHLLEATEAPKTQAAINPPASECCTGSLGFLSLDPSLPQTFLQLPRALVLCNQAPDPQPSHNITVLTPDKLEMPFQSRFTGEAG
jgi:hypothetical protein